MSPTKTKSDKGEFGSLPDPPQKRELVEGPNGELTAREPAKTDAGFVRDSVGNEVESYGLAVGAGQVQHQVAQANATGHFPADGFPPSKDYTVAAVTGNTVLQDLTEDGGTAPEDAAGFDNTGEGNPENTPDKEDK